MTDPTPTLTEMRETARMIVDCDIADNRIALARAFLTLTDPTPLTAEHCREAGFETMPCLVGIELLHPSLPVLFGDDCIGLAILKIHSPTVGQLRLALLQENRDGE